jgi:hypothetical protein
VTPRRALRKQAPADELVGLLPRIRAAIVRLAERLESQPA